MTQLLTKARFALAMLALILSALTLAACSSDDGDAETSAVENESPTTTVETQSTPPTTTAAPTTTVAPSTTLPDGVRVTKVEECDVSPLEVVIFVSKTVPDNEVKLIEEQVCLAKQLFFDRSGTNWEVASPIYIAALDRNNSDAAVELETVYCQHVVQYHPVGSRNGKCGPQRGQGCQTSGKCLFTDNTGKISGSSISSNRHFDGFHLYINVSHEMPQHEKGYRSTILHELFHVYQLSSVREFCCEEGSYSERVKDEIYRLMGRRMDSGSSIESPWWMEGVATYLSYYFYDQQEVARPKSLYNEMYRYLTTDYNGSGLGPLLDQYRDSGRNLSSFTYENPDNQVAYRIGAWFVAYMVDQVGIDKIFEFYSGLEEAGSFENAFAATFGKTHTKYLEDFDVFLEKSESEIMAIIPK